MLATVPVAHVPTLYASAGDAPAALLAAVLLAGATRAALRRAREITR
jgi:hypothetical protein